MWSPARVFAASVLLVASAASPSAAVPLFRAPLIFEVGEKAVGSQKPYGDQFGATSADLNGDGRADLIISNSNAPAGFQAGRSVSVLLANSSPYHPTLFRDQVLYPVGRNPGPLYVGDFYADGRVDVLISNGDSTVTVLAGNGLGGFLSGPITTYTGHQGDPVHRTNPLVGDLNGDGRPDLVFSELSVPDTTWTFLGNGLGSFTPGPVMTGHRWLFLRDMNGDGRLDLVGAIDAQTVRVRLGNGDGTFQAPISTAISSPIQKITVGTFDADAVLDIVASSIEPDGVPRLRVLHGLGTGAFSEMPAFQVLGNDPIFSMSVGDLDGDGHLDLAVAENRLEGVTVAQGINALEILFGDGAGNFPDKRLLDAGILATPVLGDFDGDGLLDIAGTQAYDFIEVTSAAHAVSVLRNLGGRNFDGGIHRATLSRAQAEAVADMNRDGMPDLIVGTANATFEVHIGDGNGGFTGAFVTNTTPSNSPGRFAVGDLNRDGKLDLVGNSVNILYGNGDGTFSTGGPVGASGLVVDESLADLNRDGILDLLLLGGTSIDVALGQPAGTFGMATSYPLGTINPRDLTVGDWNRDGKLDVAVTTQAGIAILLGNGSGGLGMPSALDPSRDYYEVTSGDFNRDGLPDLAARVNAIFGGAGGMSVFLGSGLGGFSAPVIRPTFDADGREVASWDVNRDGSPDLVATSRGDLTSTFEFSQPSMFWSARVWLGNGTGEFARDSDLLIGLAPSSNVTAFGDLNRDGQPDIIGRNVDYVTDTTFVDYLSILPGASPALTGAFPGHTEYGTGTGPLDLAVADFNRDGKTDVASLAAGADAVSVHLGDGQGGLGAGTLVSVGPFTDALASGDVNRDGAIDLVTGSSGELKVLLGNGAGGFAPAAGYLVGSDLLGVALGDMNRDGKLDAVVASTGDGAVNISLGDGAGAFGGATQFSMPGIPREVALADVDRDGDLDVLTIDFNSGDLDVFLGNGVGGLGTPATFPLGAGTRDVVVGDWNRDGLPDVAMTRVSGGSGFVTTAVGLGDGTFVLPSSYPASPDIRGLAAGDYNLDGIVDLVTGNGTNGTLSLYRGLGNGAFNFAVNVAAAGVPAALAIGDLNRDGQPDLVSVNSTANNVSILRGSSVHLTGVETAAAPSVGHHLLQNKPNPFNPRTVIEFSTSGTAPVHLRVFDVTGRRVATLVDGALPAGFHRVPWDGRDDAGNPAASGIYFYQLEEADYRDSKRMTLLK